MAGVKADLAKAKEAGANYDPRGAGAAWTHNFLNQKVQGAWGWGRGRAGGGGANYDPRTAGAAWTHNSLNQKVCGRLYLWGGI